MRATVEVTVRYFAAARDAAGCAEEVLIPAGDAVTVGDVLAAARAAHGDELARVLDRCAFLLDGQHAEVATGVRRRGVVDVLPPFAGG